MLHYTRPTVGATIISALRVSNQHKSWFYVTEDLTMQDPQKKSNAENNPGMVASIACTPRLIVLGAGAVGLSTAVQLQQKFPRAKVTLIADKFDKDTTSDGAAGIFRPSHDKTPGVPSHLIRRWAKDSWKFFTQLADSPDGGEAGVFRISGYQFFNKPKDVSMLKDIIYEVEKLSAKEMNAFPGPRYQYGYKYTTVMSEGRRLLPYLMKKFLCNSGEVENRHVQSLHEFSGRCDVLVNCCGLNAKYLLHDDKVYASRGHLLRVKAPWLKHHLYCEERNGLCTYVYPGCDNVTVGGTRLSYDEDTTARKEDRDAIWCRACTLVPSLKNAEILWEWVGLRPMREPLRLEAEIMRFPTGDLRVVHNYGHGGDGVTLSWGTAANAVQLVEQLLRQSKL